MIEELQESVQLNGLEPILTDAMRIARYADLETRMAEFEEKVRCDPRSFSLLPRLQGRFARARSWRKVLKISPFFPFFPRCRSGRRAQPKSWRTSLYGDGARALAAGGAFFGGGEWEKGKK